MPIAGTNFKYSFHADMEFNTVKQFNDVMNDVKKSTEHLRIYGIYKNGKS